MTTPTTDTDRAGMLEHWAALVATQDPIGTCKRPGCDGTLRALPPTVVAGLVWLEAECDTCWTGVGLPDGRRADPPRTLRPVQPLTGAVTDPGSDWRARQAKDLH